MAVNNKKILAVASTGGHWIQLLRIMPSFEGYDVEFITTTHIDNADFNHPCHLITDANANEYLKTIKMFFEILMILIKTKPNFIISTGAAPGLVAIALGKLFKVRTIWIDSIANSEELSFSGKWAKHFADVWLTQWPHLTSEDGPNFWGKVL